MNVKISVAGVVAAIGLILILVAVGITAQMYYKTPISENSEYYNTMSDWAGGVSTPLLNLAGFLMIFAAFLKQAQDAKEAKKESDLQRFEQSLFNLLNLLHQIVFRIQDSFKQKRGDRSNFFYPHPRIFGR